MQNALMRQDYPKNNSILTTVRDVMLKKVNTFGKETKDKMFNEFCKKDLLELYENMGYAEFKYKFEARTDFEDSMLISVQKYCGPYNRLKKELLIKISNELTYPEDEEDYYLLVNKVKRRIKDVYNDDGRRLVNLMMNQ